MPWFWISCEKKIQTGYIVCESERSAPERRQLTHSRSNEHKHRIIVGAQRTCTVHWIYILNKCYCVFHLLDLSYGLRESIFVSESGLDTQITEQEQAQLERLQSFEYWLKAEAIFPHRIRVSGRCIFMRRMRVESKFVWVKSCDCLIHRTLALGMCYIPPTNVD